MDAMVKPWHDDIGGWCDRRSSPQTKRVSAARRHGWRAADGPPSFPDPNRGLRVGPQVRRKAGLGTLRRLGLSPRRSGIAAGALRERKLK